MQNNLAEDGTVRDGEQTASENKYLTFWTDDELFGVPISDVVQIISMQGITPLPDFPDYAKGVINLRGNIIPVIDIRVRFGKPEAEYNENTCIIVTSIEDSFMGFIVDAVDEVTDIDEDNISPAPKVSRDITNRYLTGIGQIGEKVVLLLDAAKILSENELSEIHDTSGQVKDPDQTDKSPENPVISLHSASTEKKEGE
ncbi:chemotaxis protein CheW [Caproicibacter sp.]|uniref:chemotaxis protein CheW n=1 Tax=Caproicibacter sp. TaxID=2814884 RepID=UPI003989A1C7